eukprot:3294422-Alexandrium_andersonii.AAC.1
MCIRDRTTALHQTREASCEGLEECARPELAAARESWAIVWRSIARRAEAAAPFAPGARKR